MDYLGKGEILTVNTFVHNMREKLFVHMERFWDFLFQFMKLGTNTLHVAFIFLLSVINDRKLIMTHTSTVQTSFKTFYSLNETN